MAHVDQAGDGRPAARTWKVGELARVTGLTVRALHYYDQIGLLTPSQRSRAGHRLYDSSDVGRLYRIILMRRLGFPLDQITPVLDDPEWQLGSAVDRHLSHTKERAAIAARLCARLTSMAAELARHDNPSPEQLFSTLEEMTMLDGTVHSTTGMLVYDDLAAAHDYIVRVFGLTAGSLEYDAEGHAVHGEVGAGDRVIMLHPSGREFCSPRTLGGVSSMTIIAVDDADAHYARSVKEGADIVKEPVDQPYGVREYGARDLEGQLWYFHSALA
jgi:MerR family transcriptional regulator, thiopeptide resistance regulator